jgi:hypothetical protein
MKAVKMGVLSSRCREWNSITKCAPLQADTLAARGRPGKESGRPLGILGIELNSDLMKDLPDLRFTTGMIVAAKTLEAAARNVPPVTGDMTHSLNGAPICSLAHLHDALSKQKSGDAVVLLIERSAQLIFVSFLL